MEVKKNLNNVQRKMLDEIYMEQFKKRESAILAERSAGLKQLQSKLLKDLATEKPEIKEMLEAGKTFYELELKLRPELRELNVCVDNYLSNLPELRIGVRYSNGGNLGEFPEVEAYHKETRRIELSLAEKKKEMRAKIYGLATTYEEVDEEVKELLKNI